MRAHEPAIRIVPIGQVPSAVLYGLLPAIQARFPGRVARLAPDGLEQPDYAFSPTRGQHQGDSNLQRLTRLPLTAERLLGVADLDLFTPDLNFIFGQALRDGPAALIALARLRPEFWGRPADTHVLIQRAIKEATHELGHTFGLEHCGQPGCVLRFSNTFKETHRNSGRFCRRHEAELRTALSAAACPEPP